ncbi:MAG: hypothetical protein ACOH2J_09205 [Allorhizobium sp.]
MQLIGTQIHEERGATPHFIVEFVGDGGEVISVQMQPGGSRQLTRMNAVEKARALMMQVASFEPDDDQGSSLEAQQADGDHSPAVKSLEASESARTSGDKNELEDQLNEGLEDSFPASDPLSVTGSTTAGKGASDKS